MAEPPDVDSIIRAMLDKLRPPELDFTVYTLDDGTEVSTLDRICKDVQPPALDRPTDEQFRLSSDHDKPNIPFLRDHFCREGRLTEEQALWIIQTATELFKLEDTLLDLQGPITLCGDIRGQYYDLVKLLDVGGDPCETQYLFLGNYVNRGYFSIECLLYLWSLKITYPDTFWLLRGNYDCRRVSDHFTFRMECRRKYSERVYEACVNSFDCLPLAALLDKQILCLHGGLSPDLQTLSDLSAIDRFREPPTTGLMCDILWSDPMEGHGQETSPESFITNTTRGVSYYFSYEETCKFLESNDLLSLIRGHEAQDAGYRMYRKTSTTGFPSIITLFSAPNYLDTYRNRAAIIRYSDKVMNVRQFESSPHPYYLPNFMDVFTWSLPFVGEKLTEVLLAILNICDEDDDLLLSAPSSTNVTPALAAALDEKTESFKRKAIKDKTLAVGRLSRMFSILRQEVETVGAPKLADGQRLPAGTLMVGREAVKSMVQSFEEARELDAVNERMPQV